MSYQTGVGWFPTHFRSARLSLKTAVSVHSSERGLRRKFSDRSAKRASVSQQRGLRFLAGSGVACLFTFRVGFTGLLPGTMTRLAPFARDAAVSR